MNRISVAQPKLDGNERKYVLDCNDTSWISSNGKYISEFEAAFARFCGVKHAVAANNGTTALHLALVALDLKPGDEVIIPTVSPDLVTAHAEAFQAVVWHCLVSHPKLKAAPMKWESIGR